MKLLLYYLNFLVFSCLATTCRKSKNKPKVEHNQLNKKKSFSENSQMRSNKNLDINRIDSGHLPPLYKEVAFNNLQEARLLLKSGADPNIIYKDDCPLEAAVSKRNKEMVSLLLSYGAKIVFQEDGTSKVLDAVRYKKDHSSKEIYNLLVSKLSPEEIERMNLKDKKEKAINEVKNENTPLLSAVVDNNLRDC